MIQQQHRYATYSRVLKLPMSRYWRCLIARRMF